MALRLQIVSRHRQSLGERGCKEFGQNGGTIGRSLECDWALPDGQRFLSSRHASIDFRSGSYYIVDTSTNGVYVNESDRPVGRGKPQRLFSGDRVRIGDYQMIVEIDEVDSAREQLADLRHVDPVDLKQRVEAPDPTTNDLIDAYEVTGVGIEMVLDEDESSTLAPLEDESWAGELQLEENTPVPAPAASGVGAASSRDPNAGRPARNAGSRPQAAPATRANAAGGVLDGFFRGAGMQPRALDQKQTEEMLLRLGQLMRETIVGLTENLQLRATHKSMLRQSNTTIQPRDDNASRFSAGVDEALGNLFFHESEQNLTAVEAVRDSFGDIKTHQQILMKAMQRAIADYIARLDPDDLEEKFSNGRHGVLLGAANKFKYWDLYKDLYQVVAQQHPGHLPQVFLEDMSRAYELESSRATGTRQGPALKAAG